MLPSRKSSRRALVICALIGALLAAILLALQWRSIIDYFVTSAAIADAREELRKRQPYGRSLEGVLEPVVSAVGRDWESWFASGYLDRDLLLERMVSGNDALEALIVIAAFHSRGDDDGAVGGAEALIWFETIALSAPAKALLVDMFLGSLRWVPECEDTPAYWNMAKMSFFTLLFSPPRDESPIGRTTHLVLSNDMQLSREDEKRFFSAVGQGAWQNIIRDSGAHGEKTRSAAILLLYRHPESAIFEGEARRALGDPSPLVRLAAAGTLALKEIDAGEKVLLDGMSHDSWEIRFWCLQAFVALGKDTPALMEQWLKVEKDEWLISILEGRLQQARAAERQ